jgi:DNA-binding response OmpR family regulator
MNGRILIVDDEPDIVFMIKVILRSEGLEVLPASSVAEARQQLSAEDPDLVLLDLRLSDGEGWEVLQDLRKDGRLERTPVVVLSAHASPGTIKRALQEGAKSYVTKPFIAGELLETIRSCLSLT